VYLFDVRVWNNTSDLRLSLSEQIYCDHQKYMQHFACVCLLCTKNLLNQSFTQKCLQGQHLFSQKCEIIDQLFISMNVCALLLLDFLFIYFSTSLSLLQEIWPFELFRNRFIYELSSMTHNFFLFFFVYLFLLFVDCDIHYPWTFTHDGISYN